MGWACAHSHSNHNSLAQTTDDQATFSCHHHGNRFSSPPTHGKGLGTVKENKDYGSLVPRPSVYLTEGLGTKLGLWLPILPPLTQPTHTSLV